MNKRKWWLVAASILLWGAWGSLALAEGKIGYVDLQKVFQNYNRAKDNERKFKQEVESQQKEINKLQDEIKKEQEDLEKKKEVLKTEERQKREERLRGMLQDFSGRWKEVNERLDRRREELEKECIDEIIKVAREYGKKQGYSLILDSRVVIYGPEASDLSEEILKILNK
ncbi:MAG: OmpH family outer membrane protein [Candidatus Omnitrophica bacterium]|nr:OmpH family outer membrane protein [Candidatus Omnitrophota bacterium]MCM8768219.1 OmpH family outer membrane protein [Candidatus Omnitrophota bacterium]